MALSIPRSSFALLWLDPHVDEGWQAVGAFHGVGSPHVGHAEPEPEQPFLRDFRRNEGGAGRIGIEQRDRIPAHLSPFITEGVAVWVVAPQGVQRHGAPGLDRQIRGGPCDRWPIGLTVRADQDIQDALLVRSTTEVCFLRTHHQDAA